MQRTLKQALSVLILAVGLGLTTSPSSAVFTEYSSQPFGTFNNVEYVRHTGRFEGTTSLGDYSVPFEVVAPANPSEGSGAVLLEAPHWSFAPLGRDLILGRDLVFGRGISYASVGFGVDGANILDPTMDDLFIAGAPVPTPGLLKFSGPTDREILIQFTEALRADPQKHGLGVIDQFYAYGVSRSADILTSVQQAITETASAGLFDLALLHNPAWEIDIPFPVPPPGGNFQDLGGEFVPPTDVGNVMFVMAEGDQITFASEVFREVTDLPGQRIYEVAGAAHVPTVPALAGVETGDNPVDHYAVMRALFAAGDNWIRHDIEPPPDTLLESAPVDEIDLIYGYETGIARDANGNALGGIRLPDLAIGKGLFFASDPTTSTLGIPFLSPLSGSHVDLECVPLDNGSPRFRNHGDYVSRFSRQANRLVDQGFLLPADAEAMKERAAESDIGMPDSCD